MGALHEGHLSLGAAVGRPVRLHRGHDLREPDAVWAARGFRALSAHLGSRRGVLCRERADLVFAPDGGRCIRPGFSTYVEPPAVAQPLEGAVAGRGISAAWRRWCSSCSISSQPDVAYLRPEGLSADARDSPMVRTWTCLSRFELCPTVREPDGLAMSSRNRYLGPAERQQAWRFRAEPGPVPASWCRAASAEAVAKEDAPHAGCGRFHTHRLRGLADPVTLGRGRRGQSTAPWRWSRRLWAAPA